MIDGWPMAVHSINLLLAKIIWVECGREGLHWEILSRLALVTECPNQVDHGKIKEIVHLM